MMVALVTGGARGIGHAIVQRLAVAGHRVVIADRAGAAEAAAGVADTPPGTFAGVFDQQAVKRPLEPSDIATAVAMSHPRRPAPSPDRRCGSMADW
jgi:NAD(P)-dependent dehydrogenase (short-subunit alcohol dehydrogenase family)